jgi:hypothetical protein
VSETARFRFTAIAGQNLAVGISGLGYVGTSGGNSVLAVYGPNAGGLAGVYCNPASPGGDCKVFLPSLAAGTYSVMIQPTPGVKITGTVALSSDLTGTLVAGTPQSITVSRVGQRAAFTFSGTTGTHVTVTLSGVTVSPTGESLTLSVYLPNGSFYTSASTQHERRDPRSRHFPPPAPTVVVDSWPGYPWQGQLLLGP